MKILLTQQEVLELIADTDWLKEKLSTDKLSSTTLIVDCFFDGEQLIYVVEGKQ